jgi:hypothetical protein
MEVARGSARVAAATLMAVAILPAERALYFGHSSTSSPSWELLALPKTTAAVRIGTAGWSIPTEHAAPFPALGSHLERYAAVFDAVEINSSFYRPHRPATYERWAASVPEGFRFAVKVPKAITHERRLKGVGDLLNASCPRWQALGLSSVPCWCSSHRALLMRPARLMCSCEICGTRQLAPSSASRGIAPGLHRTSRSCSMSSGLPEWPLIQHPCRELASPAAGVACRTGACTDHHGCTIRPTARRLSPECQRHSVERSRRSGELVHLRQHGSLFGDPRCARYEDAGASRPVRTHHASEQHACSKPSAFGLLMAGSPPRGRDRR